MLGHDGQQVGVVVLHRQQRQIFASLGARLGQLSGEAAGDVAPVLITGQPGGLDAMQFRPAPQAPAQPPLPRLALQLPQVWGEQRLAAEAEGEAALELRPQGQGPMQINVFVQQRREIDRQGARPRASRSTSVRPATTCTTLSSKGRAIGRL